MEVVEEHGNPKLGTGISEELVIANLEGLPSGDIFFGLQISRTYLHSYSKH